jgi:molecular chaperone HtpG
VDAELDSLTQKEGEEAPQLDAEKLTALVREASGKDDLTVEVKPLANDAIPMMLIEDEQSRRWSDMSRIYGRNELKMPAKYTAVLNSRSKTVQKLSQREKDERSLLLTRQLCDLAELSRQPLEAERMTEFIRRSMEIVNLAAEM